MNIISKAIAEHARKNPAAPAIISSNRSVSYSELLNLVAAIGNHIERNGGRRGRKAILNFADSDLRLIAALACLHCGIMPFILLDIGDVAEDIDYDLVIGSSDAYEPSLKPDILIDEAVFRTGTSDEEFRDFGEPGEDDIFFVCATSGTTGRPKMVAEIYGSHSRRKLNGADFGPAGLRPGEQLRRYTPEDRVLFTVGDVSKFGFNLSLTLLLRGAAIVRLRSPSVETIKAIELFGVNRILTTPSAIELMTRHLERLGMRCPKVRAITLTGGLFQPSLLKEVEKFFDAEIRISYGSAEAHSVSGGTIRSDSFQFGYVGEVTPGVQLVSTGTRDNPGQLTLVNRPGVYALYYSKGKIIKHEMPFYQMPDLGYLVGSSLYLVGRVDEVFNWSGNKIAFSLIEGMLREDPRIADVGLVGGAAMGDPLGLLVGLVARTAVDLDALRASLCALMKTPLAAPHIHFVPMDAIPRNPTGKVERQKIVDAYKRAARPN